MSDKKEIIQDLLNIKMTIGNYRNYTINELDRASERIIGLCEKIIKELEA